MIITNISEQARDPERANIYVDGKFYAGLNKLVVFQLGLKVGMNLTTELAEKLGSSEGSNNSWDYALRSLSMAPKSKTQITRKLTEKFGVETAQTTIERLTDTGLVDDWALARNLVEAQLRAQLKSRLEIKLILETRMISKEAIQVAMELIDGDYEARAAQHLVEIKSRGSSKDPDTLNQKIGQYLARKGFSYTTIKSALMYLSRNIEQS